MSCLALPQRPLLSLACRRLRSPPLEQPCSLENDACREAHSCWQQQTFSRGTAVDAIAMLTECSFRGMSTRRGPGLQGLHGRAEPA